MFNTYIAPYIAPGLYTLDSLGQLIDKLDPVKMFDLTVEPHGKSGDLEFKFESNSYEVSGLIELNGRNIFVTYTGLTDLSETRPDYDPELEGGCEWLNLMGYIFAIHVVRYADMKGLIPDRTKRLHLP